MEGSDYLMITPVMAKFIRNLLSIATYAHVSNSWTKLKWSLLLEYFKAGEKKRALKYEVIYP